MEEKRWEKTNAGQRKGERRSGKQEPCAVPPKLRSSPVPVPVRSLRKIKLENRKGGIDGGKVGRQVGTG